MRALLLKKSNIIYSTEIDTPKLTSVCNVLVKVYYAGICRTDIGVAKGAVPAKDGIILGHEFCGEIVGFLNGAKVMDNWSVGDAVSANPMAFGGTEDTMCGKDCDGAFAEYIAVPSLALVELPHHLLTPMGAFLEPVAAALAPLKYIQGRTCVYGDNRIAELTRQLASVMGHKDVEQVKSLHDLQVNGYDCLIETEADHLDTYVNALKPGGVLVMKSRSFAPTSITTNAIAMKEICIRGVRYGDFHVASQILTATSSQLTNTLDTSKLFGNVYELSEYETAFAEAEQPGCKKIFFRICAE